MPFAVCSVKFGALLPTFRVEDELLLLFDEDELLLLAVELVLLFDLFDVEVLLAFVLLVLFAFVGLEIFDFEFVVRLLCVDLVDVFEAAGFDELCFLVVLD